MRTTEYLVMFTGENYRSFNNREFVVTAYVDIRGIFDSVNIPLQYFLIYETLAIGK